jgi:pimeloyl-ACP methyl ester carboxylesterase
VRQGEVRSLSEIVAGSVARPGVTARDVHTAVAARVFGLLGPLGAPARVIHDGISRASYAGVSAALRAPVEAAGRLLADATPETPARGLAESPAGAVALGALNGVAGDRIARDHPDLALGFSVRRRGREVPLSAPGLADAFDDATTALAVFVHGLCGTEDTWRIGTRGRNGSPSYGARLRDDLGFTPLYVRYNTGRHVSDNGRSLATALERIAADWPVEVEEIALIGHSMGGLVARSACHYGERASHAWTDRVRHVFCLGTPHLGAPLERAANVADWALSRLPESRPFAELFLRGRSAGIKDMRFGNCIEEDWCDCDPDEFLRDRCKEVPFLPAATYYFLGATLSKGPDGIGGLIGDLLVQYPSASGNGRRRRIPFELDHGRHIGRAHHLRLLNHPDVYEQIRDWIGPAGPVAA